MVVSRVFPVTCSIIIPRMTVFVFVIVHWLPGLLEKGFAQPVAASSCGEKTLKGSL
jgi:hypothetical protein